MPNVDYTARVLHNHTPHNAGNAGTLPSGIRAACLQSMAEHANGGNHHCSFNADHSDSLPLPSGTTSEPLSYELVELDSDAFVLASLFVLTKHNHAR